MFQLTTRIRRRRIRIHRNRNNSLACNVEQSIWLRQLHDVPRRCKSVTSLHVIN